jgi:methyltransferase
LYFQKRKHTGAHHYPNSRTKPSTNGTNSHLNNDESSTSKPSAVFHPGPPRTSTLSIALPGSIIANAKSHDQKTYLCGAIARALAVFNVDEIVIFNDEPPTSSSDDTSSKHQQRPSANDEEGYTALSDPSHFLAHVLSYLETPPHLRKSLFPMHPNLRTAGTLPSLDMPHHLRSHEFCPYREGVTTKSSKAGTEVDVGLSTPYFLPGIQIPPNARATLQLTEASTQAKAVSPTTPREEGGYYWGYSVRRAASLSAVFTDSPFDGGYDFSIGTSERGEALSSFLSRTSTDSSANPSSNPASSSARPKHTHTLLLFGGIPGLESAANNDPLLTQKGISGANVSELFDEWINLVPGQGSRTIRTEEAVWIGLMGLRGWVEQHRG